MKGKTNNPNGRPKGKPNRVTSTLRESIVSFVDNNWAKIEKDFGKVSPTERLRFFEKLIPYVIPKLQRIEYRSDEEKLINNLSDEQVEQLYSIITRRQDEDNCTETH